jgi:hypothetical protein
MQLADVHEAERVQDDFADSRVYFPDLVERERERVSQTDIVVAIGADHEQMVASWIRQ